MDERIEARLAEREDGSQPTWMSIEEAAGYLGVSERTIERLVASERITSTTLGRRRLLRRADLDAYAEAAARRD